MLGENDPVQNSVHDPDFTKENTVYLSMCVCL
jgi:hypothetical protein